MFPSAPRYIVGVDFSGAFSRKSNAVDCARGRAHDHEAAAADVAGRRVRDGQREGGRDGRVHRVAAARQHRRAGIAGGRRRADHQSVRRPGTPAILRLWPE